MFSPRILIVEDELLIGKDIAIRLEKMGYEVFPVAPDASEALKRLKTGEVDICLLDINLGQGMDGISLAHQINQCYRLPFIFVSSHSDQITVERAKDSRPSAYILKPFDDKELQIAIDIAVYNFSSGNFSQAINKASYVKESDSFPVSASIFIRKKERFDRILFEDILWAEAQSNYTLIQTKTEKYITSNTLKQIAEQLKAPFLSRIHRSYLINLHFVEGLEGNQLFIGERAFPVSRSKREEVFKNFKII
ncbi:LytR/AlgR family response regulator transcription factor [Xanthovirga aplysinae]|uniref:LytR/AlgR family response regulator transcription factor n=1 Tax=Xanthovirga aplysinae TaxID=2529853 RepID=UPI0012BD2D66|nr:response regulator [Xanthovirga aplysinae]MTI33594.1 response regulator transcription factor [Xanthovirga aplysinae]